MIHRKAPASVSPEAVNRITASTETDVPLSQRAWLHLFAVGAVCLLALLFVSLHRARGAAQLPRGDDPVSRGYALAAAWCMSCHGIGPLAGSTRRDLDFEAIANMHSTTELSLRVFLQSSHRTMPNIVLKRSELDDLIAFILSLKQE